MIKDPFSPRRFLRPAAILLCTVATAHFLSGCAYHQMDSIPTTSAAGNPKGGRALLAQCVEAHGGQAAYARLHDVNVRYAGHWAALGPKLQPKLSDTGYRGGSEERYLVGAAGFTVGQHHTGDKGEKWVYHAPLEEAEVGYHPRERGNDPTLDRPSDPEVRDAAALVVDAYASFLFGPYFFQKRAVSVQKLDDGIVLDHRPCDRVLAILQPGLGRSPEDRVVLCIDQQTHLLRRVQFTLEGLESTRGAEVYVDLMAYRRLAGVEWPTEFYEHILTPVNLPAHRWRMTGLDTGRGYGAGDLTVRDNTGFRGRADHPANDLVDR